jgi:hypothetical protein
VEDGLNIDRKAELFSDESESPECQDWGSGVGPALTSKSETHVLNHACSISSIERGIHL